MEQQQDKQYTEDEAMKVILTPQAYKKYLQEKYNKDQKELSDEEKAEIEKQMSDPFRTSDSQVVHWLKDLWDHPEKCQWYRDHVLFPSTEEKHFMDDLNDNPNNIRVEIPIISMDF